MVSVGPIREMATEVTREGMEVTITCVVVRTLSAPTTNRMFLPTILPHKLSPVTSAPKTSLIQEQVTTLQLLAALGCVIIRCTTSDSRSSRRQVIPKRLKLC